LPVADRLNGPARKLIRYRIRESSREWLVQERNANDQWIIVSRWPDRLTADTERERLENIV
jgi:hypothetical protein